MFIDPEKKLCKIVTDNRTFIYDKDDKVLKESLNENDINPELYKPFGHDSYDSGYIHEPELPD